MKKIIVLILLFVFMLCGCSKIQQPISNLETQSTKEENSDYVKAIWIAYYELQNMMSADENEFTANINNAFDKIKSMGFNTICVQVRPCADSFYYSKYFPISKYCLGKQGMTINYDPLKVMCQIAKEKGLLIEAWINPYRVSQDNNIDELSDDNIAKKWYENEETKSYVYISKKGIYFNPAVDEVTELIVNGVVEIVENYDISAIHFDDYFYPTTKKDIDKLQYNEYKKENKKTNLAKFRRSKVSNMVKNVYSAIKKTNSNVKFGISPASNIENDYSTLYADVEKWSTEQGYVDYICPQIYFGFKNAYQPFMLTTKKWVNIAKCDLYVGLPLYKANKKDEYASQEDKNAINEFKNNSNIIARQITYLSKLEEVKGYYVFSYGCLFEQRCEKEIENMLSVMQNSNPL